jgi:hypothetical protein
MKIMRAVFKGRIAMAVWPIIIALGFSGCAIHPRPNPNPKPNLNSNSSQAGAGPWQAGLAEINITPPIGFRMAGYFEERISTGIHDPLKAKAIVLRQDGREVALVFCDLLGLSLDVSGPARAAASRATGIPITNIVIAATHSHTGPLFDDVRADQFHQQAVARSGQDAQVKMDYPAFLTSQLVKVIVEAHANLQPVGLDAGITGQPGLPFNRDYYMKDGSVVFNPGQLNTNVAGPAGPADSDVDMLLVKPSNGAEPVGGLTVFAMHADTIGGTEFSADYPFYIQQTLRKVFGSNYISAFGAGACGNLNHIDISKKGPVKGFDVAEELGGEIGVTVLTDISHLQPVAQPALASRSKTLLLPLQPVTARQVMAARVIFDRLNDDRMNFYAKVHAVKTIDLAQRGTNWPIEIQAIRLGGETAIVCLPAEMFTEFGLAIKKASPFKQTFIITICNDRPGYVPTLKAFDEGTYEVMNSRLRPGSGEIMVETAVKMLNDLKRNP